MSSDNRRQFLARAAAFLVTHPIASMAQGESKPVEFKRIRLQADKLDPLAHFYQKTLGLEVAQRGGVLTVQAGATVLEFTAAAEGRHPYYHFAFNIPENKLGDSMEWLRGRCPILQRPNGGGEIYHFANWNAHSCYFSDPAGNLLEFIARHTLRNESKRKFTQEDILSVSEIGLVSPEVPAVAEKLHSVFGVSSYMSGSADFMPVGNEHGLFILVRNGRSWNIIDRPAEVFPVSVSLKGGGAKQLKFSDAPYVVEG